MIFCVIVFVQTLVCVGENVDITTIGVNLSLFLMHESSLYCVYLGTSVFHNGLQQFLKIYFS